MRKIWLLPVLLSAFLMLSCKSQYDLIYASSDMDLKYKTAFDCLEKGKYLKASRMFESLAEISGGTDRDDTIKFYWGYSNYMYKDYYTAESNFEHFLSVFPRSPFAEEATYLRIKCLYRSTLNYELDQSPTYKALNVISEFLIEHPESEHQDECRAMLEDLELRLDRKAYEGARLYYHIEDYIASRVALRNVLKEDADNVYREDILYLIAMSSYKYAANSIPSKQRERFLVFVDDYFNFTSEFPESSHKNELDGIYSRVQRYLKRHKQGEASIEEQ